MMSLHIDSAPLSYTLQLKHLCNVPHQFSNTYFSCLCDNDTKRYHKITLGVTNFEKQAVFSRKTSEYFYYFMFRYGHYFVIYT